MTTQREKELFVRNLKSYMQQRGEGTSALASQVNLSRDTIRSYLALRIFPRPGTVYVLAKHFGVGIDAMFTEEPIALPPRNTPTSLS